jgi:hypothetical protein
MPATVNVFVNDINVGMIVADLPRKDLIRRLDQTYGYEYEIPADISLFDGDNLRLRVEGYIRDLEYSPIKINLHE